MKEEGVIEGGTSKQDPSTIPPSKQTDAKQQFEEDVKFADKVFYVDGLLDKDTSEKMWDELNEALKADSKDEEDPKQISSSEKDKNTTKTPEEPKKESSLAKDKGVTETSDASKQKSNSEKDKEPTETPKEALIRRYKSDKKYDWQPVKKDKESDRGGINYGLCTLFTFLAINEARTTTEERFNILEIGAGLGTLTIALLSANKAVHVDVIEIGKENIKVILERVGLISASSRVNTPKEGDISKQKLQKNKYHQVNFRNVGHILPGEVIDAICDNVFEGLVPNGTFYIEGNSPYHGMAVTSGATKEIATAKQNGKPWPGFRPKFREVIAKTAPDIAATLPEDMHFLDASTMKAKLEHHKFKIRFMAYSTFPNELKPTIEKLGIAYDEREIFEMVAVKPG